MNTSKIHANAIIEQFCIAGKNRRGLSHIQQNIKIIVLLFFLPNQASQMSD